MYDLCRYAVLKKMCFMFEQLSDGNSKTNKETTKDVSSMRGLVLASAR